jgi:RimJ/RimL family protein N-acetyltransferase
MKPDDVEIRRWEAADFPRLAAAAPGLSLRTLYLRFRAGMPGLPASYLRSTEQRWPARWDAVVAVHGDQLVGWAEFGRYPDDPDRADIGICVVDAEQGHGIGSALAAALLEHARAAGLVSVHADIEPDNAAARRAWRRATGSTVPTFALAG